ncbi:hypothetical protein KKH36_03630 [Patescibacteria group bacterium]|nr:hypothetical protein [Patescibacteria group bacterium]
MNLLLSIISGIFLTLSYNYNSLWFISFISLTPLLYLIYNNSNFKKTYFYSHLTGFIYLGFVFSWLFDSFPLGWMLTDNLVLNFLCVFIIWFITVFFLSSLFGLLGILIWKFKTNRIQDVLLISSTWVLFEYLRGLFYFIFSYSSESLFGSHFTFGLIGYNLAHSKYLIKLASLGGIYLLSFLVVLINAILFYIFINYQQKKHLNLKQEIFKFFTNFKINKIRITYVILIILIIFSFLDLGLKTKSNSSEKILNVAILQTKFLNANDINNLFSSNKKKKIYEELINQIKNESDDIDLILLPENTDFTNTLFQENKIELYEKLWPQREVLVVDSTFIKDRLGKIRPTMQYYNIKNKDYSVYEKQLLVPTGESLPYFSKAILKLVDLFEGKNYSETHGTYSKSNQEKKGVGEINNSKIGILFCSEVLSPKLYQDIIFQEVELIGLSSSYATFRESPILLFQLEKAAKIRAVESNRYYIQSSNYGYSLVIDNQGEIVSKTKQLGNDYLISRVKLIQDKNLYFYLGDWILFLSLGYLFFITGKSFVSKK